MTGSAPRRALSSVQAIAETRSKGWRSTGALNPRRSRATRQRLGAWATAQLGFVLSLVAIFCAWEVVGQAMDILVLPPFSEVVTSLWTLITNGTLLPELTTSLVILAGGLAISVAAGVVIGALMGVSRYVRWALDVYVNAGMVAPLIAFVPVFLIVFGLGRTSVLATVVLYAIFPVIVNTEAGIRSMDRSLTDMGRSFGGSPWQIFWRIRVPGARDYIKAGIQIASGRAVKGLISGEVLISVIGLGGLVHRYGTAFSMAQLYGLILFIIVLALVVRALVDRATDLIVSRLS
jgi:NitT/TauT family transport system permease protein